VTVSTKELRIQPGKIIAQVAIGQEITVTYRGEPIAKIVPFQSAGDSGDEVSVFGMWKDHDSEQSVEEQVRNLRKGRQF
jgi:prevent-host-death family protein